MIRISRTFALLALAALVAAPLSSSAQEEAKKKERPARAEAQADPVARFVAKIELTEEQTKQVAAIKEKFNAKIIAARSAAGGKLNAEQRKARAAIVKQAKADGKTAKDVQAEIAAAVKLTPEQQEAAAKSQAELKQVMTEVRAALVSVLTDEQAQAAGLKRAKQDKAQQKPAEKKKKAPAEE